MRAAGAVPAIDVSRCTGCGRCVAACRLHLLSLDAVGWMKCSTLRDGDRCTACAACVTVCPFNAIAMRRVAHGGNAVADPEPL